MKINREKKRQNAIELYDIIHKCKTEDELERADDMLDELMLAGYIFKKDYKFLSEELDDQIGYLVEEGLL